MVWKRQQSSLFSLYTGSQLIRVRWPGKDMDRWKRSIQIDDYYYQWKIEAYCYQLKIEDYWHKSKVEKYQGAEELPESFWPSLGLTPSAHKVVCSCTHQVPCIFKIHNWENQNHRVDWAFNYVPPHAGWSTRRVSENTRHWWVSSGSRSWKHNHHHHHQYKR